MQLDQPVLDLIHRSKDEGDKAIAVKINREFGINVPLTVIRHVLMNDQRRADLNKARDKAASSLDQKLDRIEDVGRQLEELFIDETLPMKERLEAVKELRQWTKLGIDSSGIHDKETGMTFVISSEWDVHPESDGD